MKSLLFLVVLTTLAAVTADSNVPPDWTQQPTDTKEVKRIAGELIDAANRQHPDKEYRLREVVQVFKKRYHAYGFFYAVSLLILDVSAGNSMEITYGYLQNITLNEQHVSVMTETFYFDCQGYLCINHAPADEKPPKN